MFHKLIQESELHEGAMIPKAVAQTKLLIVHHQSKTYIIENKCGHFGMPLETGNLEDGTIVCSHHRISFDLITGEISNRPFENCDAIRIFEVIIKDGIIGVEL